MTALVAALPIAGVLIALLCGRRAGTAALAGLGCALLGLWLVFPVPSHELVAAGRDWLPIATEVMLILGGGIFFAEAGRRTGVQAELSAWIGRALGRGLTPMLAVVHGFTPLTESLTGYGIGAALAVPLLRSLGLSGTRAAVIGLLGLCAVPWGSMGPGTMIAAHLSGVPFDTLGVTTALFNLPVVLAVGAAAALLTVSGERRGRALAAGCASGALFWALVLAVNVAIGTSLAGALGGLGMLVGQSLLRRLRGTRAAVTASTLRAAAPYGLVLGGMLLSRVLLRQAELEGTGFGAVLGSPASCLLLSSATLLLVRRGHLTASLSGAAQLWARVAPSTVMFIALGAIMGVAGMTAELAEHLATLGNGYWFLLPVLSAFGGFVTGSNSGANALAAGAQADVVRALGGDLALAMGAHNAGAAAAIMAAPARVELAAQLAQVPEERGRVQRTLLGVVSCGVVAMGVGGWLFLGAG